MGHLLFPSPSCPSSLWRGRPRVTSVATAKAASADSRPATLPRVRKDFVYLDHNATTPVHPEVLEAMLPFLREQYGNPSSGHARGRVARAAVERAREQVAALIGARHAEEVHFTGSGTEANHWAIQGRLSTKWDHTYSMGHDVLYGSTEHPSVTGGIKGLWFTKCRHPSAIPCQHDGVHTIEAVATAIKGDICTECHDRTTLTLMHANNETGCLNPLREVAALAHESGVRAVHTDAAQSVGKVPVDVQEMGVDLLTLVGHKFGAPKGVAALYVKKDTFLVPILRGGGQESGMRAGTENVAGIVGLGAAAASAQARLAEYQTHTAALRDWLQRRLLAAFPQGTAVVHGPADPAQRLPNTLSIGVRGLDAAALLAALADQLGASAGAACHSGGGAVSASVQAMGVGGTNPTGSRRSVEVARHLGRDGSTVSATLQAMGVDEELARGTLRLSVGRDTRQEEVERGAALILEEATRQGLAVSQDAAGSEEGAAGAASQEGAAAREAQAVAA